MAQLTVPIVIDNDAIQRMVDEKVAELKAQFIPKDQYEARLKADMVAMLEELKTEIEELKPPLCHNASRAKGCADKWRVEGLIQQKIDKLKEVSNEHEID